MPGKGGRRLRSWVRTCSFGFVATRREYRAIVDGRGMARCLYSALRFVVWCCVDTAPEGVMRAFALLTRGDKVEGQGHGCQTLVDVLDEGVDPESP